MATSLRDTCAIYKSFHSTTHWKLEKFQSCSSYRFQLTNRNTAYSYITKVFVCCQTQQFCNGHNHTQNLVIVVIKFQTILNEKVGCRFFARFWLWQKVFPYTKQNIFEHSWRFLSEALATTRKMANDPDGDHE